MGNGGYVQKHPEWSIQKTEFEVKLLAVPPCVYPELPPKFVLKLSSESADIIDCNTQQLICHIIYTDIDLWTCGPNSFTLELFKEQLDGAPILLSVGLSTADARLLSSNILRLIQDLMIRMENDGYTRKLFPDILQELIDEKAQLRCDWMDILGTEKKLTAFQALDIYRRLNSISESDRMDSICHLYSLLLDKSMFQLLVNALDNEGEIENVLQRLNLQRNPQITQSAATLVLVKENESP